jgi:uncharacterized peroxidase-related enzyme
MSTFQVHTIGSAPTGSKASLEALEHGLGFVPNLAATMAGSPTVVNGFVELRGTLARGELTGVEREIVAIAVSVENDCDYCVAAHSTFALMAGAEDGVVSAARDGRAPEPARLAALYAFARRVVTQRGHVSAEDTQAALDAGLSRGALLEAIAQIGHTTIANFAHSLSDAPLDDAFAPEAWAGTAA